MTITKLIEALQIFAKYDCDEKIVGEYEKIIIPIDKIHIEDNDWEQLELLGFTYHDVDLMVCDAEWDYNE